CSAVINPGQATTPNGCPGDVVTFHRSDGASSLSAPYPVGITTITWMVTDFTNPSNVQTCVQTITVLDTENPTITCPPSITRNNDPGQCSAVTDPGQATAVDNCPGQSGTNQSTGTTGATAFSSGVAVSFSRSDGASTLSAPYPVGVT